MTDDKKQSWFRKHLGIILAGLLTAVGAGIYQGSVAFVSFLVRLDNNQAAMMRDQKTALSEMADIKNTLADMQEKDVRGLWGSSAEAKAQRAALTERMKGIERWMAWVKPVIGVGPAIRPVEPPPVTETHVEDHMMEQTKKFTEPQP